MPDFDPATAPAWAGAFLVALRDGKTIRDAALNAGIAMSTAYSLRNTNPGFEAAWLDCKPVDARRQRPKGAAKNTVRIDRFLEELAETSNVTKAAAVSGLDKTRAYHLRRHDPDFARRWYEALAEGYDNLELELLQHLRGGDDELTGADDKPKPKRKFDTATALRCLTAHRESVAREKGRQRLAEEVATIATINKRIDDMRARARANDAAIRKARREKTRTTRGKA